MNVERSLVRGTHDTLTCFFNQKGIQPYFPLISLGCKTSHAAKSFRKRRVTLFTSRVVFLPEPLAIFFGENRSDLLIRERVIRFMDNKMIHKKSLHPLTTPNIES